MPSSLLPTKPSASKRSSTSIQDFQCEHLMLKVFLTVTQGRAKLSPFVKWAEKDSYRFKLPQLFRGPVCHANILNLELQLTVKGMYVLLMRLGLNPDWIIFSDLTYSGRIRIQQRSSSSCKALISTVFL